jgi:hypothetical protein
VPDASSQVEAIAGAFDDVRAALLEERERRGASPG